ncbi:MAG: hypothetical protein ACFFD4_08550 [Candidatus Odinarchaeota archaeon]
MPSTDIFIILYQIFIFISIPLYFWTGYKLWRSYESKKTGDATKWMALFFLSGAVAIAFLLVEQVILMLSYQNSDYNVVLPINNDLPAVIARILVCTAILISSGFTAPTISKFALTFFDNKRTQLLIYPIVALGVLHAVLYFILPFSWFQRESIWEYYHADQYQILLLSTYLIPVWLPVAFLGYVTVKARKQPPHIVKRSFLLFIGLVIVAIAYSLQVISPSIITGFGLFYFALHYYFVITMPNWLKKILNWPENG